MAAMYFGGMILSSLDDAYRYEDALVRFMHQRIAMFDDRDSFWGRNIYTLMELCDAAKFPSDAFYYIPSDPLVVFPDIRHRVVILKRRHLNRLRQDLMKRKRQGR